MMSCLSNPCVLSYFLLDLDVQELPPFDFQSQLLYYCLSCLVVLLTVFLLLVDQVLFFIKYYDPYSQYLTFLGHLLEPLSQTFGNSV